MYTNWQGKQTTDFADSTDGIRRDRRARRRERTGEHARLACWFRQLAETFFGTAECPDNTYPKRNLSCPLNTRNDSQISEIDTYFVRVVSGRELSSEPFFNEPSVSSA